ncbi:MAG: spermidine synthase, partial [Desulfobacteraceae bacterium 4572_89]
MTSTSSSVSPPGSGPESKIEDYQKSRSRALQFCLFATGCSGIVAEFVLSTLATYLMGNATLQWTLIMSFMLFAMGLGSRWSRNFKTHLLDTFIVVEMLLSSLCALSAVLCFGLSIYMESREAVIYPLALAIGFLIGLEIPLATRINSGYQELRTNIASVLEMDYFGSLLGGILFAFVFLPFLGFAYTPVLLGSINFLVALWLLVRFHRLTHFRKVLSRQTRYQKIVMTRWRSHYWLYINGQEQFSTYDEERYHEPLVHPAMGLASSHGKILILGGGDGLALREVLKYRDVGSVTLVDLDPVMTRLAKNHPVLTGINHRSFHDPRVEVVN